MRFLICIGILVTVMAVGFSADDDGEKSRKSLDVNKVEESHRKEMSEYLSKSGLPPKQYIGKKFGKHDLVIVGETHQVRENCLFIAGLIETLYQEADVDLLLTEFVRNRNTDRLNKLLIAKEWDAEAIHEIMRDWAWPTWGFKEYREIFHAAWRVNQNRKENARPFRIVGLDNNWDQYEYGWKDKSKAERFQSRLVREEHLISVAEKEVFKAKRKALVHIGYSHSITGHGLRFGTVLTQKHGDRIFQVILHTQFPMRRGTASITKLLDSLWAEAGAKPVGFDVLGSPLGVLCDRKCVIWNYLKNGLFEELAKGYVILKPADKLNNTTWIPGFITPSHFKRALDVAIAARWTKEGECDTAKALDLCMQKHFPGIEKNLED